MQWPSECHREGWREGGHRRHRCITEPSKGSRHTWLAHLLHTTWESVVLNEEIWSPGTSGKVDTSLVATARGELLIPSVWTTGGLQTEDPMQAASLVAKGDPVPPLSRAETESLCVLRGSWACLSPPLVSKVILLVPSWSSIRAGTKLALKSIPMTDNGTRLKAEPKKKDAGDTKTLTQLIHQTH